MSEIMSMTMAQVKLYTKELSKLRKEEFHSSIICSLYGSRASSEDIEKILE